VSGAIDPETPSGPQPLSAYQRKLFVFLSVATFFEGYDFMALSQILPQLRQSMALDQTAIGAMVTIINVGTVLAFGLVRLADRVGRKGLLTVTIVGYTLATFLTGFAPSLVVFTVVQLIARMFLIAEWATSMVYAAEEFPSDRRGMVIGVIQAFSSLGAIACAGVVPLLLRTSHGWRSVYFVGIAPLIVLMVARRGLRESSRFAELDASAAKRPFSHIWTTPYRGRVLLLALVWGLAYLCLNNATLFWKEFAVAERGLTDADVGLAIAVAAVASMPLVFLAGKLLDVVGRKAGAAVIFLTGVVGVLGAYGLHGVLPLAGALVLAIFGANGFMPVLNAFSTELFPTELRADAFAWSNNLLGRISYVLSPLLLGWSARRIGWGPSLQLTTVGPLVGLALILALFPETRARNLDDTSVLH
jgi:putative MFS transporter